MALLYHCDSVIRLVDTTITALGLKKPFTSVCDEMCKKLMFSKMDTKLVPVCINEYVET